MNIVLLLGYIATSIVCLCVLIIFVSIIINFIESKKGSKTKKVKKSIVETGTMTLFFFGYYAIIRFELGRIDILAPLAHMVLVAIGLMILILGCYVNVKGRLMLGKNWANQIKIYKDHILVKAGVYSIVRHPLYASLIWMFYAGSMIYLNYAAFFANTLIFIPFMYYRAKQEELLLSKEFKDYSKYKKEVGMFFPRIL